MILARNNYSITFSSGSADTLEMELYVYRGVQTTDRPASVTARILAPYLAPLSEQTQNYVFIDIGPYIMDEMETQLADFLDVSTDKGVWVDYRTRDITSGTPGAWSSFTEQVALPGYGRFIDGTLASFVPSNSGVLMTSGITIYIPEGERLTVPVPNNGTLDEATWFDGTTHTTIEASPGSATDTNAVVLYEREPVDLETTGIYRFDGVDTYSLRASIERVPDPNNQATRIYFMNRLGAIQEMWFFGRKNESFSVKGITTRRDTKRWAGFDRERHQYIDYSKNGRQTYTLNSGFQVEANNELFKELLMSEQIWMDEGINKVPVRILSSNLEIKSQRWDRLINYTIQFEAAFDYSIE